jgi:hypothetical protein
VSTQRALSCRRVNARSLTLHPNERRKNMPDQIEPNPETDIDNLDIEDSDYDEPIEDSEDPETEDDITNGVDDNLDDGLPEDEEKFDQ